MVEFQNIITRFDFKITEDTTLGKALQLMLQHKWSVLPITDGKGNLCGVFTRTCISQMVLKNLPLSTPISPYIKKQVETVRIDTPIDEIKEVVKNSAAGTGVVVNHEQEVVGLLTKTDMVLSLLESSNLLKEQLETIVQYSHIGVVMTDENRKITYVNSKLGEISGIDTDTLVDLRFEDVFSEILLLISEDGSIDPSQNYITLNFTNRKAVVFLTTYHRGGNEKGYIALFHDISEMETMAEELETVKNLKKILQTTLDYAYDGIIMVNEKQIVQMVSPPFLELFDIHYDDVIGKSLLKTLPELSLSHVFETHEAEFSDFNEKNGIKYIVHRIPIIQEGKVIGAIGKVMFRQLNEVSELLKKLQKAENKAKFYHNQYQQTEFAKFSWDQIISEDSFMDKLKKSGAKAAKGRSTILIRGESGTGKELFAHAIHNSSARKEERFVIVNCAAIPEDLLESEFFGYEEGAFTGAKQRGKLGKFDLANGGTLFLDEIGDMSVTLQAKLLRVLQEREFYRVGGSSRIKVDVRIIAATNRHLEEMVKQGLFREDLYYRLNVISLRIPPLRDRKSDIDLLVSRLMIELNSVLGTSMTGIELSAQKVLYEYDWPGNVRELKNVLERAMTFAEHGKIQIEDLPEYMLDYFEHNHVGQRITMFEDAEINAIKKALEQANGNKAEAARILGISRSSLYEKLKKYQVVYSSVR